MCVKLLHCEFLQRICKESGLQGLRYHGGAISDCSCQLVLDYVSYDVDREDENGEEVSETTTCSQCLKSQNIDEILKKQVMVLIYK